MAFITLLPLFIPVPVPGFIHHWHIIPLRYAPGHRLIQHCLVKVKAVFKKATPANCSLPSPTPSCVRLSALYAMTFEAPLHHILSIILHCLVPLPTHLLSADFCQLLVHMSLLSCLKVSWSPTLRMEPAHLFHSQYKLLSPHSNKQARQITPDHAVVEVCQFL